MSTENNDLIPMGAPASDFAVVMRGYERNQVNDAISRLEDDLRTIMAERDQAVQQANDAHARAEQVSVELTKLKNELLHTQAPTFETMGGRIASMMRLAEEEASEIRKEAEADAEQLRAAAREEREQASQQISSDRAEADQYIADHRREADEIVAKAKADAAEHLDTHRKLAEETLATAQTEAATLTAESEARRKEAEDDFKINLDSRRKAAQQEEADRDQQTRAEAAARIQASRDESDTMLSQAHADSTATVDEANAQALRIITEAENEVNRLQNLRSALAQQIMQIGQLVGNVPAYLAKPPEDLPLDRDVEAPSATAPTAPALFSGDRTDDLSGVTEAPAGSAPADSVGGSIPTESPDTDGTSAPTSQATGAATSADGDAALSGGSPAADEDQDSSASGRPDATSDAPYDAGHAEGSTPDGSSAEAADPGITLTHRRGNVATEPRPVQVSAIRQRRTKR